MKSICDARNGHYNDDVVQCNTKGRESQSNQAENVWKATKFHWSMLHLRLSVLTLSFTGGYETINNMVRTWFDCNFNDVNFRNV